ncbi:MAG: M56 family metallopeptidase [Acidobacteriota bacterium]
MTSSISDAIIFLSGSVELSLLAKATILLVLGLVAAWFAARQQAAVRHLAWAATFAALVVLPLFLAVAPKAVIEVPVPVTATAFIVATPLPPGVPLPPLPVLPSAPPPAPRSALPSWQAILRALWIAGAVFFLAPVLLDIWRLRRLRRNGLPWPALRDRFPIDPSVELLLHESIPAPLTCGLFHHAIILPADAPGWTDSELRCALTHELEHVRRHDWAVHLASRAIAALYWFHPLVWTAWRRLCLEAERACDDAVLQNAESTDYAGQLVSLARRMSNSHAQIALGMAHRGDLSTRVSALLDHTLPRGRASRLAAVVAIGCATVATLTLAPVNAVAQPVPPQSAAAGASIGAPVKRESRARATALDRALFEAAEAGELTGIGALLNSGANVNALIQGDGTPLLAAARKGNIDAVRLLLDRGADPNLGITGDGNPLLAAAGEGHIDCVLLLLDRGAKPDAGVSGDGNALITAAQNGHLAIAALLLDRGASIDLVIPGDENAIIQASESGQLAMVKYLTGRGANVNSRVWVEASGTRPAEWRTPLNRAQKFGHAAIADYLKSVGARE